MCITVSKVRQSPPTLRTAVPKSRSENSKVSAFLETSCGTREPQLIPSLILQTYTPADQDGRSQRNTPTVLHLLPRDQSFWALSLPKSMTPQASGPCPLAFLSNLNVLPWKAQLLVPGDTYQSTGSTGSVGTSGEECVEGL